MVRKDRLDLLSILSADQSHDPFNISWVSLRQLVDKAFDSEGHSEALLVQIHLVRGRVVVLFGEDIDDWVVSACKVDRLDG